MVVKPYEVWLIIPWPGQIRNCARMPENLQLWVPLASCNRSQIFANIWYFLRWALNSWFIIFKDQELICPNTFLSQIAGWRHFTHFLLCAWAVSLSWLAWKKFSYFPIILPLSFSLIYLFVYDELKLKPNFHTLLSSDNLYVRKFWYLKLLYLEIFCFRNGPA